MSDEETKRGAMNRAQGAKANGGSFDLYAGIRLHFAYPALHATFRQSCLPSGKNSPHTSARLMARTVHCEFACLDQTGGDMTGLEGGLEVDGEGKMKCFAWMIIISGGESPEKIGSARTATFELPEKVMGFVHRERRGTGGNLVGLWANSVSRWLILPNC